MLNVRPASSLWLLFLSLFSCFGSIASLDTRKEEVLGRCEGRGTHNKGPEEFRIACYYQGPPLLLRARQPKASFFWTCPTELKSPQSDFTKPKSNEGTTGGMKNPGAYPLL